MVVMVVAVAMAGRRNLHPDPRDGLALNLCRPLRVDRLHQAEQPQIADSVNGDRLQRLTMLHLGLIQGGRMTIHLSRLIDNAPVRDVAVKVLLRGAAHPATAETDGSFSLQSADLALPGSAAVDFLVTQAGGASETLKGTLVIADGSGRTTEHKNTARQLWWWVLNFAVCIGFLYLISRRRKSAQSGGSKD